jgi:hypothetical protein
VDVDELRARVVLLDVVAGSEVHGRRWLMMRLPLVLDIMKICMDFGPYDIFSSSDVLEMADQQNS